MPREQRQSIPVWRETTSHSPRLSPLRKSASADVCIVGAGIAGLTAAYLLQKQGRNVIVLDAGGIAAGESGRTSAHLSNAIDDRYFKLEERFGQAGARLARQSHGSAIDRIETIASDEGIDCGFERCNGYLVAAREEDRADFDKEAEAALRVGFDREVLDSVPLGGADWGPAIRFPRQAAFHALDYLHGLAAAVIRRGGRVHAPMRVKEFKGGKDAHVVTADGIRVNAEAILVATDTPVNDRVTMHTKQMAYRTYAIAIETPRRDEPMFLFWDMDDPYHYVRPLTGHRGSWLIVGGEDHKTGQANDGDLRHGRLDAWARLHFPGLGAVSHRWSGQVMEPADGLGFAGRNPNDEQNVFIITGDSGNGLTHGTLGATLVSDLILGRSNPWEQLYDPSRKPLHDLGEYAKENLNTAGVMVKDWVKPSEIDSPDDLAPGSGAVMRRGASKVAIYRAVSGEIFEHSAVCPHLKCVVQWNDSEQSWDCPCHGSRFDAMGEVLNGPAVSALAEIEPADKPG